MSYSVFYFQKTTQHDVNFRAIIKDGQESVFATFDEQYSILAKNVFQIRAFLSHYLKYIFSQNEEDYLSNVASSLLLLKNLDNATLLCKDTDLNLIISFFIRFTLIVSISSPSRTFSLSAAMSVVICDEQVGFLREARVRW